MRRTTLSLALAVLVLGTVTVAAQRASPSRIDLGPADAKVLSGLELRIEPASAVGLERRAVSDIVLRLSVTEGALSTALGARNGMRPPRRLPLMTGELIIVSGGRAYIESGIACGGWVSDVSICAATCEGGQFALERTAAGGEAALAMHVGRLPPGIGEDLEPGFRLAACRDGRQAEIVLAPSGGTAFRLRLAPR